MQEKGEGSMATKKSSSQKKSSGGRKYSPKAQKKVARVMREKKSGKLKSGRSGKTVNSRKQAIAIGLSEARKEGAKVPKKKSSSRKRAARRRVQSKEESLEKELLESKRSSKK